MTIKIEYVIYTAAEFVVALKDKNRSAVARGVGVSHPTIRRLARGDVDEVSIKTRANVTDYLQGEDK